MSKELEVVACMYQHEDTGNIVFVDQQQVEWGFEKNNPRHVHCGDMVRLSDAQAEITGLKTYAAAIAAERDAAMAECSEQARLNGMGSEREARLMAERDALANELAEATENHRIYYDAWVSSQKACAAAQMELASLKAQSEPVGEQVGDVTINYFRGNPGMANHHFDYYGNLPEGTRLLYTHPAPADKDGERYRFLRKGEKIHDGSPFICRNFGAAFSQWTGEAADSVIDAAMIAAIAKEGKNP